MGIAKQEVHSCDICHTFTARPEGQAKPSGWEAVQLGAGRNGTYYMCAACFHEIYQVVMYKIDEVRHATYRPTDS